MNHSTQHWNNCSPVSERIFILRPRASRILLLWWIALHSIGVWASVIFQAALSVRLLLVIGLLSHLWIRWPQLSPVLVRYPNGTWDLPAERRDRLRLGSGTRIAPWWVQLVFREGRWVRRVVLLRDQFDAPDWRDLQSGLRRPPQNPEMTDVA